jgi:hypothetical protein
MLSIFLKYFLILVASLGMFYLLGLFASRIFRIQLGETYFQRFVQLVLGLTTFVICFSIFITRGQTVSLAYLIMGIAFILVNRKEKNTGIELSNNLTLKISKRDVAEFLAISTAVFLVRFFSIYSADGIPVVPHADYVYYANLSEFLNFSHKENSSINYPFISELGPSPYHYYDSWVNAGIIYLFQTNSGLTLMLVTYTLGPVIAWYGLLAIANHFNLKSKRIKILCFLLLFIAGAFPFLYDSVPFMNNIGVFSKNIFTYSKLFPIYLFGICSVLFFLKKEYNNGILALFCLPIAFVSTFIGVILGVALFMLIEPKINSETQINRLVIFITLLLLSIFIYFFYRAGSANTLTHIPSDSSQLLKKILGLSSIKTSVNIIGATVIQLVLLFAPFIIIIVVLMRIGTAKLVQFIEQESYIVLLIFILAFSLLTWSAMFMMLASVQTFSNFAVPFLNIATAVIILLAFRQSNKRVQILFLTLVVACLISNLYDTYKSNDYQHMQDTAYLKEVQSETGNLSQVGAFIIDKEEYNRSIFSYISNFAILGSYLIYSEHPTFPLTISAYDYKFSKDKRYESAEKDVMASTPFMQYVEKQKQNKTFHSVEESQVKFIDDFHINYLIATANAKVGTLLSKRIKHEIVDSETGERFYLLN